jgi:hypothetical protein
MLSRLPTPDLTGTGGCQPGHRRRCRRTKEALASVAIALTRDKVPTESICSQVACELAANATVHSHSRKPGGHFTVRAQIRGGRLRVEVHDQGGPWTWPVRPPDGQHGHGLLIVAQLTRAWGRTGDSATGWTVWYELDCPSLAAPTTNTTIAPHPHTPRTIAMTEPIPAAQYDAAHMRAMAAELTAHGLITHVTDSRAGLDLTATLSPSGRREAELIIDLCRLRDYAEGFGCRLLLGW